MTSRASRALLCALAVALPAPALADLFSPGDLARPHANLEGLSHCTDCHVAGKQLSEERCLECHKELKADVAASKGFHGKLAPDKRACETCHHDHQGRDYQMVEWPQGKKQFDHGARTGFPLRAKHAEADCEKCHDPRRITDPKVKQLLKDQPKRATFLGLPQTCQSCHFDEHRKQLPLTCEKCHDERGFKPAPKFDHAKTEYRLEGKHAKVACDKCHLKQEDGSTAADAFPAPKVAATFVKYKEIPHAACTDCHKDPHQGKFGDNCVKCHTVAGWRVLNNLEKERGFHEKTRFPLRGAHTTVDCKACHAQGRKFRGTPFERCTPCHLDAHWGTIAEAQGIKDPDCTVCHDVESFKPAKFELEQHQKTRFALEGSHKIVGCTLCHTPDPKLAAKVTDAVRKDLKKKGRLELFSAARLPIPQAETCHTCHQDVHDGQFTSGGGKREGKVALASLTGNAAGRCADCHSLDSFHQLKFDHQKDSRFPLTGKHLKVGCEKCHLADAAKVVRYKPLATDCASCHRDIHLGQLAEKKTTRCEKCHVTEDFKKVSFTHAPPFTTFLLEGKHQKLECQKCHPPVQVAPGEMSKRYKPLPRNCAGCHADAHKGAFAGLEPSASGELVKVAANKGKTRCEACHSSESWLEAKFDHSRTGFDLKGQHARAMCQQCHTTGFEKATPRQCAGCHLDVHQGQLGKRCEGCHDESNWRTKFSADAHRTGNFPLSGRHALIPCQQCHLDERDRTFSRATQDCAGCHQQDYQRTALTSMNHQAAGFSTDCRSCHQPFGFSPARFPQHDDCFQISGGPHGAIRCLDCHSTMPSLTTGATCQTGTAACTRCHTHSCDRTDGRHKSVPGYQCKDRKCYECHRFSKGGG